MSAYLRAAERIADGRNIFACEAIDDATVGLFRLSPEREAFNDAFLPESACSAAWLHVYPLDIERNQHLRVMALLFMHWMTGAP